MVEKEENQEILIRRIISFRQLGEYYKRDEEIHYQQLYKETEIAQTLEQIGFQVEISDNYGEFNLPPNHKALIAKK